MNKTKLDFDKQNTEKSLNPKQRSLFEHQKNDELESVLKKGREGSASKDQPWIKKSFEKLEFY